MSIRAAARMSTHVVALAFCVALAVATAPPIAAASNPVPVVGSELPAGTLRVHDLASTPADGQRPRAPDGSIADWVGRATGYAGSETYSHGELIYTDHLWDAYGASSPADAARDSLLDAVAQQDPDLYRAQGPFLFFASKAYGAGPLDYAADLDEVRVADAGDDIELLARTTVMTATEQPAILVLVDTTPGAPQRAAALPVPFGSGITTRRADVALLLTARQGVAVDLVTGARHTFATAADPAGYDNAIEASIPRALIGSPTDRLEIAVAAGRLDPATGELAARQTGPALANVAFRTQEPVRPVFDKLQAAALEQGTIDPFFADVDLARLRASANQTVTPGPGYYERVMSTDPAISRESDANGLLQDYGLYVPSDVDLRRPAASTVYLHGSDDSASLEPSVIPGLMRALGDERRTVVIAPQGRTGLSLWEGAGLEDLLEAWGDAGHAVRLDPLRNTLTGYSMGGYGAFLVAALFPDRFAATWSIEGLIGGIQASPVTAIGQVPDVRTVFPNVRWAPTLIEQGGADTNVDVVNGQDAENALHALGYRSRLLLFPGDTHYSPGVVDRWDPEVAYLGASPRIDPNPPRVTYVRDMAFERDVDHAMGSDQTIFPGPDHDLHFDHAYWMSGLTPANPASGKASIDVRSLAIPSTPYVVSTENGSGGSPDPYTWSGDEWTASGRPAPISNGLTATAKGATAVALDARRMRLNLCRPIAADVSADRRLTLRLSGRWPRRVTATLAGRPLRATRDRGGLVLRVPAGRDAVRIAGRCSAAAGKRRRLRRARRVRSHRRDRRPARFTG